MRDLRAIRMAGQLKMLQGCGGRNVPEVIEITQTPRKQPILGKSLLFLRPQIPFLTMK